MGFSRQESWSGLPFSPPCWVQAWHYSFSSVSVCVITENTEIAKQTFKCHEHFHLVFLATWDFLDIYNFKTDRTLKSQCWGWNMIVSVNHIKYLISYSSWSFKTTSLFQVIDLIISKCYRVCGRGTKNFIIFPFLVKKDCISWSHFRLNWGRLTGYCHKIVGGRM